MSDSPELLKPDTEVTDSRLQTRLGNLEAENETLKADYATLLKSSAHIANKLREEVWQLRSQLAAECADREEIETQLADLKQNSAPAGEDSLNDIEVLLQLKALNPKSKTTIVDIRKLREKFRF